MTMGVAEMQKARAIKCGKNRRRRRRSTGSHDQSSSVSEEEGDGSARRGKRRLRKSRSLSFGSSADSHDDVDGQRCVRFNPVPEVYVFSNRADKRKWKELRRQQSLNGNTEFDSAQPKTSTDKICKLKSSLKDTRSHNITSDDANAVSNSEVAVSNSCEDTDKYIFIGDEDDHDGGDNHASNGDDAYNDDDVNKNDDNDDSFVKLGKPQLTNSLIFDLDD